MRTYVCTLCRETRPCKGVCVQTRDGIVCETCAFYLGAGERIDMWLGVTA